MMNMRATACAAYFRAMLMLGFLCTISVVLGTLLRRNFCYARTGQHKVHVSSIVSLDVFELLLPGITGQKTFIGTEDTFKVMCA